MHLSQLEQLKSEKSKLHSEKIALENHLEAEQEFIMNKLQKQVDGVRDEKRKMAEEKAELAKQVAELATTMERLKLEKVKLEQEMEVEEENITNRLQRQVRSMQSLNTSTGSTFAPHAHGNACRAASKQVFKRSMAQVACADSLTGRTLGMVSNCVSAGGLPAAQPQPGGDAPPSSRFKFG